MSAILDIVNNLELVNQGITLDAKQGAITDLMATPYRLSNGITVNGNVHRVANSLATGTAVLVYDAATAPIATFVYGHFWADVTMYVQLITSTTESRERIDAKAPKTFSGKLIASGGTTPITGGAEPGVTAISKIYVGNYTGSVGNYILTLVN